MAKNTLQETSSTNHNEKDNESDQFDEVNMSNSPTKSISTKDPKAQTSKKSKNKKVKQKKNHKVLDNAKNEDLYIQPFLKGWQREIVHRNILTNSNQQSDVYYKTPDGKKMRSIPMVAQYLKGNPSDLTIENFTYAKRRVYKEPDEIERNALQINKGVSSSTKKTKSSPKQISVQSLINISSPKNEEDTKKPKRVKKAKPEEKKVVVKELKKNKKETVVKEKNNKNVKSEKSKPLEKKNSLEKRQSSQRQTKKKVEEKEKMEMKSIDDDIEQLQSLSKCSEHDFNTEHVSKKSKQKIKNTPKDTKTTSKNVKTTQDKKTTPKDVKNTSKNNKTTPKDIKNTLKDLKNTPSSSNNTPIETKTDSSTKKISRVDYMNKVDQLAVSDMSYEEKVAAIRNLAKNSLSNTPKTETHRNKNSTPQNGTEEMGKVFEETEDFSDSECSLFSHEDENESEKASTPTPVKKKRKAADDDDEVERKNKKQKKEDTVTANETQPKPAKRRSLGTVSLSKKRKKSEDVTPNETSPNKVVKAEEVEGNNVPDDDVKIEKGSMENKSSVETAKEYNEPSLSNEPNSTHLDQECSGTNDKIQTATNHLQSTDEDDKIEAPTNHLQSDENDIKTDNKSPQQHNKSPIKQTNEKSEEDECIKNDTGDPNQHQMLVISAALKLQMDLSKAFVLKVDDKSIKVTPQQVFSSRNKVTLKLPSNSLPSDYNKNQKLPLVFSVDKMDDHEILNVSFRKV